MIDRGKIAIAVAVSGCLLLTLFWMAGFELPSTEQFEPRWLLTAIPLYAVLVALRAATLRALALQPAGNSFAQWIRLAARHQALFMVAPAGSGDFGFPLLAKRYAHVPSAEAVRIITQYRLRDALILALAGVGAALMQGLDATIGGLVLTLGVPVLLFTDDLAVVMLSIVRRMRFLGPVATFLEGAIPPGKTSWKDRLVRTGLALASWTIACLARKTVFTAAGVPLSLSGILTVIVALNVAGALAVSVAGFGVAEAGVAGALIALGMGPAEATAAALVTRPLLLLSMVGGCAAADLAVMLLLRLSPAAVARP
jgi:uncharacterized membrane protein YbhN (UPF0104 family)